MVYADAGSPTAGYSDQPEEERAPDIVKMAQASEQEGDISWMFPDEELGRLAREVIEGVATDEESRKDWVKDAEMGLMLLSGKRPVKTTPWPNASNVVYPILQDAVYQFAARAYPGIIQGQDVVKSKVRGADPQGLKNKAAQRIAKHMGDQLLEQSPNWQSDTDKLLHQLAAVGQAFRKVTWKETEQRPHTKLVNGLNLIVNQNTESLADCPRITEKLELYPHEITERMRTGVYREVDVTLDDSEDKHRPQTVYECHIRCDLDDDGYPEPWIVTVLEKGETVLSVVANFTVDDIMPTPDGSRVALIKPRKHFIGYHMVPDPEGNFYGKGFGSLLNNPQDVVDTILNQIIDSATLQNAGGGFIGRGVNLNRPSGEINLNPRKWMTVNIAGDDLRRNIVPFAEFTQGPTAAMFQILGLMLEAGKNASFITDVLSGDMPGGQHVAEGTVLALTEQGLQVFTGIYKRIYLSLTEEYRLIFDLNGRHLPPEVYGLFLDEPPMLTQDGRCADYQGDGKDIAPVGDPSQVTSMQRMAQAQFMLKFAGAPGVNTAEIYMEAWKAARVESPERFLDQSGPPPEVIAKVRLELANMQADIVEKMAKALKAVADAEAAEAGANIADYNQALQMVTFALMATSPGGSNGGPSGQQGGMGGVVGLGGGSMDAGGAQPLGGGLPGGMASPLMGQPRSPDGNGSGGASASQGAGADGVGPP